MQRSTGRMCLARYLLQDFEIEDEVVKMKNDDARNENGGVADEADLDHAGEGTGSWKYFPIELEKQGKTS